MHIDTDLIRRDLAQLVAIPSVGGSPGETSAQKWCAAALEGLGLNVDLWPLDLDALRAHPDYPGEEVERSEAWGCVGTAGEGTPELILNGHLDVVPPGDANRWTGAEPWLLREDDGAWFGRGVCDMKGGVVALLAAVRAVGDQLTRPFSVHSVIGEEDGGLGTFASLERGHTGRACLIAEPTDGHIVSANAGSLTFRLEVFGRSTHGSMAGHGVNAVDQLELVTAALRELDARRNAKPPAPFTDRPWPISIGIVQAGEWASTVPDVAIVEGRYGVQPGESFAEAIAAFEGTLAEIDDPFMRDHPVVVTWPGGRFAAGSLPAGDPFGDQVAAAVEAAGAHRPQFVGAPYGSDLRQYSAAGIPTVQIGPGNVAHAHAIDERVAIADVVHSARAYAHLLLERCG